MIFDPSSEIQDILVFGEFGDVNSSITDFVNLYIHQSGNDEGSIRP